MATKIASAMVTETSALQQAYTTACYEINYGNSQRLVDAAIRDEDVRKLKFQILLLEDENEDLLEQLTKEEEDAEMMRADLDQTRAHREDLDSENQSLADQLRTQTKEAERMRAELDAYENMSADSHKILKDKLSLQSELSRLKPELDHLRAEAAINQGTLAEKLSLQREVSGLQVELENAKRSVDKARAKADKSDEKDEKFDARLDELERKLAERTQSLKEAKREIEQLQKELASEKKAAERAGANKSGDNMDEAEFKMKMEELRQELAAEKRERMRVDKAFEKEKTAFEAQKSILDDKLDQFRAKLRSTKEKLKDTEAQLKAAQASAHSSTATGHERNPRKRTAADIDPDAMIGTPGNAAPAKRGKRMNAAAPVEKSMFSITPFLNRTMSIAPESPPKDDQDEVEADSAPVPPVDEAEPADGSPIANAKKATTNQKPLAIASSTKHNAKPKPTRAKAGKKPTLEKVTEEETQEPENVPPPPVITTTTTTKIPLDGAPKPPSSKPTLKPRKSLADTTFNTTLSAAEKIIRKKRKILGGNNSSFLAASSSITGGGGVGKTLFDEDEDADEKPPVKPIPGRGLFGARFQLSKASGLAGLKGSLGGNRSVLQVEEGGFQFSPLKKDRRAAAAAVAAAAGK